MNFRRRNRRGGLMVAVCLLCVGALAAGCSSSSSDDPIGSAGASDAAWSFTDAQGKTVTLDHKPERIVMWQDNAAALWDYGIRPVGTWGWQPLADQAGLQSEDVSDIKDVTDDYSTYNVDLEKLAALQPDLVVAMNMVPPVGKATCCFNSQDEQDGVAAIVPWVALGPTEDQNRQSDNLEWSRKFAESLGFTDSPESQQATQDYEDAVQAVQDAAAANPDVEVMGLSADDTVMYLANPEKDANWDMQDYAAWGVNLTGPTSESATADYDGWYEDASWENAKSKVDDEYGADVILMDSRSKDPMADAEANPVWSTLDAVKAGQVGTWYLTGMSRLSLWTKHLQELAALINSAQPVN